MTDSIKVRGVLIQGGVDAVKEYGYPNVTSENVMSDRVYSAFFQSMLEGTKGRHDQLDLVIDQLLQEIAEAPHD